MEHSHIVPPRVYAIVYFLLLILMALTFAASYVKFPGQLNNVVAMLIAITKAVLVVLFFMQVKYGTRLTKVWAALGFVWLIFLFGTIGDYISRNWISVQGW